MTTNQTLPDLNPGDRIRLTLMPNDDDPIPIGTTGTVRKVRNLSPVGRDWQIDVEWDIDRSLMLVPGDEWEVIT